jgi:hypothetical protein
VGLSFGFVLNFVAALVTWIVDFDSLWLVFGVLALGFLISMPIFYFKLFRPTVMSNARRIDRYGLEERLITMVEYEGDASCVAELQRRDAAEKLATVKPEEIKLRVPKWIFIVLAVAFVLGAGMSTVNVLSIAGIFPSWDDFIEVIVPEPEVLPFNVMYMVEEGGIIVGDEFQAVYPGERTTEVIAVADDGYAFMGWDDGGKRPTRSDANITEDVVFTAIFAPLGDNGFPMDGDGEPADIGDQPGDQPGDKEGEGEGEGKKPGNNKGGAGGEYLPSNQVIDGETYYGGIFEEYQDKVMADMTENLEMSAETKDFVKKYFDIIQALDPDAEESEN